MNALIVLGNNFGWIGSLFNRSPAGTLNSLGATKNSEKNRETNFSGV
jgi:hypothetical protein